MDKLVIAVGQSRTTKIWKNTNITWDELVERLKTTTRTPETQGEFTNMRKSQQDNIKDVGGFVGGKLKEGRRKSGFVDKRYILTLDADYADTDFCGSLELYVDYTYCIYSTHKHRPENPRLRLLIPLSRPCTPDEYEAIARLTAQDIGIDKFDDTTYQPHRLMYWPSTSIDGEYIFKTEERKPLDADKVLSRYEDWTDITSWPMSSRTVKSKERTLKKQEDPTVKKGIVGAFCRTYDIDSAIEKFLPDIYTACDVEDRYTYAYGSTAAGLVVYDSSNFAYSNHATDPVSGMLCNAFDLVRLHLFGDKDEESVPGTPAAKLPSYLAMQEFAANDKCVRLQMHSEKMEDAKTDFKNLIETDEDYNPDWVLELAADSKGRYAATIANVKLILEKDLNVRGKIAFNEFTLRYMALGVLPWNESNDERDWTDTDDAGLRYFLEKSYGIKKPKDINDAWMLVTENNTYHPVRDYLEGLAWDGLNRVDTLLIDYLGAEDNDYVRTVTRKTLTAAVARIYEPGIKFDTMLALVGEQGGGKSQIVKRLSAEWGSDTLTSMQGKDAYEQLQGFWIIEVGELAAMKKADVETIKHFISKSEDSYRAAYAKRVESHKRQCIFIATTNKYEFLRDTTGNRRFLPVDVNPKKAAKNMWQELDDDEISQLWAEAVEIYKAGETIFIDDERIKKMAEEAQNGHFEESPLTGDIKMYLDMLLPENWDKMSISERRMYIHGDDFGNDRPIGTVKRDRVCAMEIWCELFYGEKKDLNLQKSREIKDVLIKSGEWEQHKSTMRFGSLYGHQKGFTKK